MKPHSPHLMPSCTSFLYVVVCTILLGYSPCALVAQSADSLWLNRYEAYYSHDHQGHIDTLIANSWKAFYLAREHQSTKFQNLAMGKLINTVDVDSFSHYLAVLDTFPKSTLRVHIQSELELSYYRNLLEGMDAEQVHGVVEEIIQKADSVYADSLYDHSQGDAHTIYLLNNRKYLSLLIEHVTIDSQHSPFYRYLTRFNRITEELPDTDTYHSTKLNSYLTIIEVYLEMKDYARVLDYSERVIQGIVNTEGVPADFQQMKMAHACIVYTMCYAQLQCFDDISPERLSRNWTFVHSPYGHTCRTYLSQFSDVDYTAALYYYMAKKWYGGVISKAEAQIVRYADDLSAQYHFVEIQNLAIERSGHPERYLKEMTRNFTIHWDYQALTQNEKEIDFANLYRINQMKQELNNEQLVKDTHKAQWINALLGGVILALALAIWAIFTFYFGNKRKHALSETLRAATQKTIAEEQQTEHAKQMQTTCLDNMNHEIRSPLNSIVGFSELLLDNPDLETETKQQYTDEIETSSTMLLQIINDVLDTAQLETGHYTLQKNHWNVVSLCEHALHSMLYRAQPGVVMTLDCHVPSVTQIYTDKTRLLQILLNFLSNACKHTSQGHITLSCTWADDAQETLLFAVTDTGSGVPKNKRAQLFERFAKLNHKAQGTGLGLHISATLAHVMGADIGYDDSYTDGARFYLSIPLN